MTHHLFKQSAQRTLLVSESPQLYPFIKKTKGKLM